MIAGYAAIPVLAAIAGIAALPLLQMFGEVASSDAGGLGAVDLDPMRSLLMLAASMPTIFVVGIVLPFAGLMSLYRSWQEAKRDGRTAASAGKRRWSPSE